uniref:hypothetical protein n=1 Tax=Agathobacter sp. TaxID=2021311 RepID=UPI003FD6C620
MAEGVFDRIIGITDKETKRKTVEQSKAYILGNWSGIMLSMKSGDSNVRCSAEQRYFIAIQVLLIKKEPV